MISDDVKFYGDLFNRLSQALSVPDRNKHTLLDRIDQERVGHPRAATWDNGPKSALIWCSLHERDVRACHADQWGCTGIPLGNRSDPTGDQAMNPDVASIDFDNLKRVWKRIRNDLELAVNIADNYPIPGPANAYMRGLTADFNSPHCESCVRGPGEIKGQPRWVEPTTKERSTFNGRLEKAMWLCGPCERHVISKGCIPNEDELEQIRQGKLKRCPHPNVEAKETAA